MGLHQRADRARDERRLRTHDISEAERHGDRVLVLADGELLFDGTPQELKREAQATEGQDLEQAFVGFLKARGH